MNSIIRFLLLLLVSPFMVSSICPFITLGTPPTGTEEVFEVPTRSEYNLALKDLDIVSVFNDIYDVIFNSQSCFPADEFNGEESYGPLMVRLAWHCSGSFRSTDGLGGCAGGRIRFFPEASWDDNANLDKARAILAPIKAKYGDALSWGDLFVFSGTASIMAMGGPATKICAGRIDSVNGRLSLPLNEPCDDQGNCGEPHGASTVGLIYVNPQGVEGNPVPALSAPRIREIFGRMGMNDSETVALIGGGHAFGKCHGACPLGAGPNPIDQPYNPWPGLCGESGVGEDTFTSGIEGQWTSYPLRWDNEYFQRLVNEADKYKLNIGPGGSYQWNHKKDENLIMLTTDLAFLEDDIYEPIVQMYAQNLPALDASFAASWEKLTTNGGSMSPNSFCVTADYIRENAKRPFDAVSVYDDDYDSDDNKKTGDNKKKRSSAFWNGYGNYDQYDDKDDKKKDSSDDSKNNDKNKNKNDKDKKKDYYDYDYDKKEGWSAFSDRHDISDVNSNGDYQYKNYNDGNNGDMYMTFIWVSLIAAFVSLSVIGLSYIFCLRSGTPLSIGLYDKVKAMDA